MKRKNIIRNGRLMIMQMDDPTRVTISNEVLKQMIKKMVLDAFENGYWRGQDQTNDKSTMWINSETKAKLEEFTGEEWIELKGPF